MREPARLTSNPYLTMACEGAIHYQRARHLPALLALWSFELDDYGRDGTLKIINRLEASLQAERRRARTRHWCYDLNRHLALISALQGERLHLGSLAKQAD